MTFKQAGLTRGPSFKKKSRKVKADRKSPEEPGLFFGSPANSKLAQPGMFARLQALIPRAPTFSMSQSTPISAGSPTLAPVHIPNFIKIRIITWNMHDSLPKGDLKELLGVIPLYSSRPIMGDTDRMALPGLSLEDTHPYHIIVVGGQECPTLSGIPMGLAANFKHRDVKDKDKEKMKHKSSDSGKEVDTEKESHLMQHTKSLLSKHPKQENILSRLTDFSSSHQDVSSAHITSPTPGWSAILEDWFAHGVGSLHDGKPLVTTTVADPSGNYKARTDTSCTHSTEDIKTGGDFQNSNKGGSDESPPSVIDANWKFSSSSPVEADAVSSMKSKAGPYELLVKERLMGIYMAIYVHKDVRPLVQGFSTGTVPAGLIGGRLGNKGGVGISLNFHGTTLLFINAHLAAHEGKAQVRIANLAKIKTELPVDAFLAPDDPRIFSEDLTDKFDHTWIFGDLNFRVELSRLHADWLMSRKEHTQALAFDQLSKLMRDGDPAFAGLHEATINFPPTFKYDVLRTIKQEKYKTRNAHMKPSTDDGVGIAHETTARIIQDDEGENDGFGDVISLGSSTLTSNNSKCHVASPDDIDGGDQLPTSVFSSRNDDNSNLSPPPELTSHAAVSAKAAWLALFNYTPKAPKTKLSPGPTKGLSAVRLSVPGSAVQLSHSHKMAKVTSNTSATSLPSPILIRPTSVESFSARREEEDIPECDKGVYDSSSKQRVPSWCDRILWKTTVKTPEEPTHKSEVDQDKDSTTGRPNLVGQLLFQALRPRVKRNSMKTERSTSPEGFSKADDITSELPAMSSDKSGPTLLTSSPSPSQTKFPEPPPNRSANKMALGRGINNPKQRRSVSVIESHATRTPRRRTFPASLRPGRLFSYSRRSRSEQLPASGPNSSTDVTKSWVFPRRWFLPFITRDRGSLFAGDSVPDTQKHTETPPHHKGDVVCLCYRSLDDRQMRRLEGRSDHRPVIGSYAVYV